MSKLSEFKWNKYHTILCIVVIGLMGLKCLYSYDKCIVKQVQLAELAKATVPMTEYMSFKVQVNEQTYQNRIDFYTKEKERLEDKHNTRDYMRMPQPDRDRYRNAVYQLNQAIKKLNKMVNGE